MRTNKIFRDSAKSALAAGKIKQSNDIKRKLASGELTQETLDEDLEKFISGDFGSVEPKHARAFKAYMNGVGNPENPAYPKNVDNKDIYGVYGDVIIYYDADRDDIMYVTKQEFTTYYRIDWDADEEDEPRRGFREKNNNARRNIGPGAPFYKRDMPRWKEDMLEAQRVLKAGQERETAKVAAEEQKAITGTNQDFRNFLRTEYKVYPVENYKYIIDMLNKADPNFNNRIKELSKEFGIPVKKIYGVVAFMYEVQHKPVSYAMKYLEDNLAKRRKLGMFTSDAEV